jgi:hypothetical protein
VIKISIPLMLSSAMIVHLVRRVKVVLILNRYKATGRDILCQILLYLVIMLILTVKVVLQEMHHARRDTLARCVRNAM